MPMLSGDPRGTNKNDSFLLFKNKLVTTLHFVDQELRNLKDCEKNWNELSGEKN